MIIRMRYEIIGGHVHCRLFTAKAKNMTFVKCGDLTFSLDEWESVRDQLETAIEIIPEDQ